MGVFNMAMSGGFILGSLLTGLVVDILGLGFAFFIVAIVIAVSAVSAVPMIRRPGPPTSAGPSEGGEKH